jgi:general secretion pathway protein D
MWKIIIISGIALIMAGCEYIEPKPFEPSKGHISVDEKPSAPAEIPDLVEPAPFLPEPEPPVELEKYTVVVNEVPVNELLFALARDARVNVDIHPRISGVVTINAIDQTLPQILERIRNQVSLRYRYDGNNLIIQPDDPYYKNYTVDYVNIGRDTFSTNAVATNLANTSVDVGGGGGGGGGAFTGNNSTTDVRTESLNQFWPSITNNIIGILGETPPGPGILVVTETVIPSPETGVITVYATERQHAEVQAFIDMVMTNVRRQVLIQISIVEVTLSDEYRAGIDWEKLGLGNFTLILTALGGPVTGALSGVTGLVATFDTGDTSATVQLLDEFGDVTVLSSPQLMVLNNQTAILKRVENKVFFTIESESVVGGLQTSQSFDTIIHQLPVGIVMTLTPHIAANDEIILMVRPTISRETGVEKEIPVPDQLGGTTTLPDNVIPETISQEMESILRLNSGQTAILGGLMEDRVRSLKTGVPGTSKIPLFGGLISDVTSVTEKEFSKVELVIFIRPLVIVNPSIETDLRDYKQYLDPEYLKESAQGGRSL